ncbi:MAG TPA: transcriptional regulator [Verrucomicrobiales bacterium]|nr:transcriptional regulator [Verrucomicrobiales bacterium]
MNPEPFQQLDRVIHEKGRLAIMSLLAANDRLPFKEIRDTLGMTDGNVTAHLRTLHDSGYVAVTKEIEGGRSVTSYTLTRAGRKAFTDYLGFLEQVLNQSRQRLG